MILISDLNYFTQGGSVVSTGPSSAFFPSSNLTDQHPYKFTRFESVDMKDTFINSNGLARAVLVSATSPTTENPALALKSV